MKTDKNELEVQNSELEAQDGELDIPVVRYSYYDVEKHCEENGYYKYEYWFPYRDIKKCVVSYL